MYFEVLLSSFLFSLPTSCTPQSYGHHGRRVCVGSGSSSSVISTTESFIQPVHKPYITMCHGQRLCSTYKTVYKVSYRQVSRAGPSYYPECCPGWQRLHSHHCNRAICTQECLNGGDCVRPNICACPAGWTGRYCQIDVNECKGAHGCAQRCVNAAGSYRCECADGFRLARDGRSCLIPLPSPPPSPTATSQPRGNHHPSPSSDAGGGLVENVTEEVQILKNRVELLEQRKAQQTETASCLTGPTSSPIRPTSCRTRCANWIELTHSVSRLASWRNASEHVPARKTSAPPIDQAGSPQTRVIAQLNLPLTVIASTSSSLIG